jgi:glutathione synthase/RimK-type ligase-like ATP-grasp enzyme
LECEQRGIEIFRFNSETFPIAATLHFDPARPEEAVLCTADQDIAIGKADGILIRRPQWPVVSSRVTDDLDRDLASQESIAASGGLWRVLGSKCISPPDSMQAARWKVHQLFLASRLGAAVPDTIVTNTSKLADEFGREHPGYVIKALQDARVTSRGVERAGFTEAAGAIDPADLEVSPVLLQARVDKSADWRVTVVGSEQFAIRITTPDGAPLDFRATDALDCRYEVIELSDEVAQFCNRFLEHYGLRFGAFDFAEDADGRPWFLECNPAGQWGWLEGATCVGVTTSLVSLLASATQ